MILRPSAFAFGAHASSRSRNTASTSSERALSIIFGLDPGTARVLRRGRIVLVLIGRPFRIPALY